MTSSCEVKYVFDKASEGTIFYQKNGVWRMHDRNRILNIFQKPRLVQHFQRLYIGSVSMVDIWQLTDICLHYDPAISGAGQKSSQYNVLKRIQYFRLYRYNTY